MMMRDQRYQSIKPLFLKNKIQTFRDIFNVVPRSVVASDLGKENDRFMELTGNMGEFTIQELALIGNFCSLTLSEMFTLVANEYPTPSITKNPTAPGGETTPNINHDPSPKVGHEPSPNINREPTPIVGHEPSPNINRENSPEDYRYEIVRANYDEGNIHVFGDIFNYIPISRVATTIHKNRSRLAKSIKTQIKNLTLAPLVTIGTLCHLNINETLQLIEAQYQQQKQPQKKILKRSS